MTPEDHERDRQAILGMRLGLWVFFGGTMPPGVPPEAIPGFYRAQRFIRVMMFAVLAAGAIVISISIRN